MPEVRIRHHDGRHRLAPARYLSADSGLALVTTPYATTELPTQPGDTLGVLAEDLQSGWVWCRTTDGRAVWVPMNNSG